MKKILIVFLVVFSFTSCSKQAVVPEADEKSSIDFSAMEPRSTLTGLTYTYPNMVLTQRNYVYEGHTGDLYTNANDPTETEIVIQQLGGPVRNPFVQATYSRTYVNGLQVATISCSGTPTDCWWKANATEGAKILRVPQ